MKNFFLLLLVILIFATPIFAELCDKREDAPLKSDNISPITKILASPSKCGSDDEVFGTYEGYNLDQYLFREDGSIEFPIYITRVFSRDKTGWNDLIIGTPQLVSRVWDVDTRCGSACDGCCEVDKVYINGNFIGILDGANQSWSTVRFGAWKTGLFKSMVSPQIRDMEYSAMVKEKSSNVVQCGEPNFPPFYFGENMV